MKCICIRSYPYSDDDDLKFHQSFSINNEYDYITFHKLGHTWYRVTSLYYEELFKEDEFPDYFMTLSDIRKLKMQKINNSLK